MHKALGAAETLARRGIPVRIMDCYFIKPIDREALRIAAGETRLLISVEDHFAQGGLGEAVAAAVAGLAPVRIEAVRKRPHSGSGEKLLSEQGLDTGSLVELVTRLTRGEPGSARPGQAGPPR